MSDTYARLVNEGQEALSRDPERARDAFRAALAIRHAYAPLWRLYADACLRSGDAEAGYDALCRVAFLEPGDARLLARLGKLALQLGKSEAASQWSRQATAATRRDVGEKLRGWLAAPLSLSTGSARGKEAAKLPKTARRRLGEAEQAAANRRFGRAVELLREALREAPDSPDLLIRKARTHLALGGALEALEDLRKAQALGCDDPELEVTLLRALARLNRRREARALLEGLPLESRRSIAGRKAEAEYLVSTGDAETAVAMLKSAAGDDPEDEGLLRLLARALMVRGEFDEARQWLHRAASLSRHNGALYSMAATIGAMPPGSELFDMAGALVDDPGSSQSDRAAAHFALAEAHRHAGNTEEAFSHFAKGNALVDVPYDPAVWDDYAERVTHALTAEVYRGDASARGEGRIFIVSAPRSGSTLVEQILAAHPLVSSVGESGGIGARVEELAAGGAYPECLPSLGEARLAEMAAAYLEDAPAGAGDEPWVVDKNPGNFLHLGLIARLFPRARIVHCRRDPMDVGFSLFCQIFTAGHGYSYTQENIAHYLRFHARLMAHWKKTLPLPIHEVAYEALVADPEGEVRRLLDALGLPFDRACLAFHESGRDVTTASVAQVRQKIHRHSVRAWEPYADRLSPLAEALAT